MTHYNATLTHFIITPSLNASNRFTKLLFLPTPILRSHFSFTKQIQLRTPPSCPSGCRNSKILCTALRFFASDQVVANPMIRLHFFDVFVSFIHSSFPKSMPWLSPQHSSSVSHHKVDGWTIIKTTAITIAALIILYFLFIIIKQRHHNWRRKKEPWKPASEKVTSDDRIWACNHGVQKVNFHLI